MQKQADSPASRDTKPVEANQISVSRLVIIVLTSQYAKTLDDDDGLQRWAVHPSLTLEQTVWRQQLI